MSLKYFKRSGSYIDSPNWIKHKKATIIPINKQDNKRFQYPITVTLNHEEMRKLPEKITQNKPCINKYNCEGIKYSSGKDDCKKIEKHFDLNDLYSKKEKNISCFCFKTLLKS